MSDLTRASWSLFLLLQLALELLIGPHLVQVVTQTIVQAVPKLFSFHRLGDRIGFQTRHLPPEIIADGLPEALKTLPVALRAPSELALEQLVLPLERLNILRIGAQDPIPRCVQISHERQLCRFHPLLQTRVVVALQTLAQNHRQLPRIDRLQRIQLY